MKIAILGFGKEGSSAFRFLQKTAPYKNAEIWICDENRKIGIPRGAKAQLGKQWLTGLKRFDVIIRSPGVRLHLPELRAASRGGATITSPTKLFFDFAGHRTQNIIGVTGTKGKGTTSSLIHAILKAAGKEAYLAGNIGKPALDILPKLGQASWVVLELSSFQLMDMEKSPRIAVALMITSEHLDWHKTREEYAAAKANIVRFQTPRDCAVLAADYPRSQALAGKTRAKVFYFSRRGRVARGTFVDRGHFWFSRGKRREKVCATSVLRIPGAHNFENAAAAITVAKVLGIPNKTIARAVRSFAGLEHRLEFVAEKGGVRFYNDSYATTPETAEVAVAAFDAPKVLILGGSSKGSDFRRLGRAVSASRSVRAVIGIGAEWKRIKPHIRGKNILRVEGCKNMRETVRAARRAARPGDVVLLSPACASFGMFKNYTDRGRQFKKFVRALR